MIRQLLCLECYQKGRDQQNKLTAAERDQGWRERSVYVSATTPPNYPQALVCDLCNAPVHGRVCVAYTYWRSSKEDWPRQWETQFGTILNEQTAKAAITLSDK